MNGLHILIFLTLLLWGLSFAWPALLYPAKILGIGAIIAVVGKTIKDRRK